MRSLFTAALITSAAITTAHAETNTGNATTGLVGNADAPYPSGIRSVRFRRATTLLAAPARDAEKVGVIKKGARAGVRGAAGECAPSALWIQIEPRGWACETELEPTTEPPSAPTPVSLRDEADTDDDDPLVPGVYGIVRGQGVVAYGSPEDALAGNGRVLVGKHSVRSRGTVTIDGKRFWKTTRGDLIDTSAIRRLSPSRFRGVVIDDPARMPAWVRARSSPRGPTKVRATPSRRGATLGELERRTVVTVLETSPDGKFVRIASDAWDAAWVARADLRIATRAAPPDAAEPGEKWFDIDVDEQVLVAYEGERPVYATLVSTGKKPKHRTPTLITRISSKLERRTMNSTDGADDAYSVADVPWTMYYDRSYALHASYWHDGFGGERSHGCINLAPRDARALYHWSSPDVPSGWSAVYGDRETPGSLVRVRSRRDREPAVRGYARSLRDGRVIATTAE